MTRNDLKKAGYAVNWAVPHGSGATGAVYLGSNRATGAPVVVKETTFLENALIEGQVLAATGLQSKFLPDLFLNGTEATPAYLVMQPGGAPLAGSLKGGMPQETAVAIAMNILRGLRVLHNSGYVHLDLHPGNVLIQGLDPATVLVIDFGSAAQLQGGRAATMKFAGSWRAPEQLGTRFTPTSVTLAADLYAVGLLLGAMLGRRNPVKVPSAQHEDFRARKAAMRNPNLSAIADPALQEVVRKAIQYDPAQRYTSAQEFLDALRPFMPQP